MGTRAGTVLHARARRFGAIVRKPLCIDLFCGLGGWSEAFLAEGWDCWGFDIERHDYGSGGYPGQLVLQDVCTLHGAQFVDADCIVASSPCQEFSFRAQPWKVAKALGYKDLKLAKPAWWHKPEPKMDLQERAEWEQWKKLYPVDPPVLGINLFWQAFRIQHEIFEACGRYVPLVAENVRGAQPWVGRAVYNYGSFYLWGDIPASFTTRDCGDEGRKGFAKRFKDTPMARFYSKSNARKAASAQIAKIPSPLAQHIARVYKPL